MQVEIIIHPEFIAGIVRGSFSMADAKAGLQRVAQECRTHGRNKVLLDGRALEGGFSLADRFAVGEFLANALPQGTRIASLSLSPIHQESRVLENTANNRGALVHTTDDAEDAARFLGIDVKDIG
jgi:hypothetical protein